MGKTLKETAQGPTLGLLFSAALVTMLLFPASAHAYIGPGAGITMLGALWAVILAIVFALGGLLIWPIRALRRKKKQNSPSTD